MVKFQVSCAWLIGLRQSPSPCQLRVSSGRHFDKSDTCFLFSLQRGKMSHLMLTMLSYFFHMHGGMWGTHLGSVLGRSGGVFNRLIKIYCSAMWRCRTTRFTLNLANCWWIIYNDLPLMNNSGQDGGLLTSGCNKYRHDPHRFKPWSMFKPSKLFCDMIDNTVNIGGWSQDLLSLDVGMIYIFPLSLTNTTCLISEYTQGH